MRLYQQARLASSFGLCGALCLASACSDSDKGTDRSDVSGTELDGSVADARAPGSDARSGGGSQPNPDGATARPSGDGSTSSGDGCNQLDVQFEARLPTVYILVDRSSSMFERSLWDPLKTGVLEMVQRLEHEVRFGFSTYTGQNMGVCPDVVGSTALAADNYGAIKAAYDALGAPAYKGETPTAAAIDQTTTLLVADTDTGPKSILLVTDGEPDFCDDGNVTCARDAVVGAAQAARTKGIGTFIFSVGGSVDRMHLKDVANAGAGLTVEDRNNAVSSQCAATKKGAYGTPAGDAPFFEPNVNDQQLLVDTLASVVAAGRSCLFDLQGKIRINLSEADTGIVEIDGVRVPFGGADGYRMNSATQLELLGSSCEKLKSADVKGVSIDFPCEAVIAI